MQWGLPQDRHTFVQSLQPGTGPRLDFVHVELPHEPWHCCRPSRTPQPGAPRVRASSSGRRRLAGQARTASAHLLQVQATDAVLGRSRRSSSDRRVGRLARGGDGRPRGGLHAARGHPERDRPGRRQLPADPVDPAVREVPGPGRGQGRRPPRAVDRHPADGRAGARHEGAVEDRRHLAPRAGRATSRGSSTRRRSGVQRQSTPCTRPTVSGTSSSVRRGSRTCYASVLQAAASNAGGDPALRLYRSGDYVSLFGKHRRPARGTPLHVGGRLVSQIRGSPAPSYECSTRARSTCRGPTSSGARHTPTTTSGSRSASTAGSSASARYAADAVAPNDRVLSTVVAPQLATTRRQHPHALRHQWRPGRAATARRAGVPRPGGVGETASERAAEVRSVVRASQRATSSLRPESGAVDVARVRRRRWWRGSARRDRATRTCRRRRPVPARRRPPAG